MNFTAATKLTAIIGNPVTHSLSPVLHNAIYEKENIDAVMLAFGNADVGALVAAIRALPIHLAAVTMPHKQTIMPLLGEVDPVARAIGAVNTVVNRGGNLKGYNTDVVGIAAALSGVTLKNARVLLVGAGGAARTAAYLLNREGANIFCVNRERQQALELQRSFGGEVIDDGEAAKKEFDVIINATPVGMHPNPDASPVPDHLVRTDMVIFDLVYSPLETKLLRRARAAGARAISGLTMFLAQGLEQEHLWLGRKITDPWYNTFLEEHVKAR